MSNKITFSLTKKVKQNSLSLNNRLSNDLKSESIEDKDFVLSIDDKQIQSTVKKEEKKDLVIPLIVNNRYFRRKDLDKPSKNETIDSSVSEDNDIKKEETLEELAKRELLEEVNQWVDDSKSGNSSRVIPVIDALIQNRVPEGFESEDNFDVSLRPIEPTVSDYQTVPVEEFGLALLRGMGWKEGMAIGNKNTKAFIPSEPQIRPKGLGLGAQIAIPKPVIKTSGDLKEDDLQPRKGSFVCIEFGPNKGSYGVIEDFDEEMTRITVRLTLKKETLKIPLPLVRVVSKSEYQTEGKVINKSKFEEYIQNEDKREKLKQIDGKESKNRSERDHKRSDREVKPKEDNNSWLLPNLKVRIVDKHYKNGKYYKEKVVITEVLSNNKCLCKTSDERILTDISDRMLETVIPRHSDTNVMILSGDYKKQLAFIVDRNKTKNEANVRLLSDKSTVLSISFDYISEYVRHS